MSPLVDHTTCTPRADTAIAITVLINLHLKKSELNKLSYAMGYYNTQGAHLIDNTAEACEVTRSRRHSIFNLEHSSSGFLSRSEP